ncbi:helix-turn-helix domain-containing protein [Flavobacterium xanthum]|uniref:Transcriptional regulator, contains XRE-family HTH domain n=1 Tax=Flavobacterium xanthum TaxID=69322 RepID=A0A1M7LSK6_9FLAO|nr:helix-turn-helix domain-containing protein [Flavobacterium xanthum]SHM80689.1 Transcriptional regulator, contains XRE-family HTH domain [Flavobacterium xanthum]
MKRKELIKSKEYWISKIQLDLFEMIENYRKENNLTKTQLAEKLGVSKGYISQILNGNFDHKISKLVDLALAFDKVPLLEYENVNNYILNDSIGLKTELTKQINIELNYSIPYPIKEKINTNNNDDYFSEIWEYSGKLNIFNDASFTKKDKCYN